MPEINPWFCQLHVILIKQDVLSKVSKPQLHLVIGKKEMIVGNTKKVQTVNKLAGNIE